LEGIEGVVSLRDNKIPKGMVSLERIFDLDLPQDKCKETTLQGQGIIPLNLGMPEHPQEVYLGSSCTLGE